MSATQETSAVIYMDSSALVKRYLLEVGTTWTKTLCDTTTNVISMAEIGLVEIASAFAGKLRGGFTTPTNTTTRAQIYRMTLSIVMCLFR